MDDAAQIAKEWWMLAVLGVASLVCGILAIAYPDVTLLAVGIIFGFYLLMAGVFELVEAIVGDPASRALSAIVGVVALIAGLICLRRPGDSLLAIVVVLGAYLIVTGIARLVRALASVEHRGWGLLSAVVDLILGVLILSWPDESLVTLAVLFGISLIFRGIVALVGAVQLRRLRKAGGADTASADLRRARLIAASGALGTGRAHDAAKADVRRRGVDRLALARGGAEAQAVVRRAQVRAALDHAPGDVLAGEHARRAARVLLRVAVGGGPVVRGPLPDVARHVVEPVAVGRERRHR